MEKKKPVNELTSVSKFIEKFFDGVRDNTARRFIANSAKTGLKDDVIDKMKEINKSSEELKALIRKYSK